MPPHLPPTQSVWALSDTANDAITIARGVLEAATSDNINPVALLSCTSFGAILPVCVETRYKIEQLARRSHTSHVLNFIRAQVGYRKGDSVEQLSNSDAGVRFLCLAATLCTLEHYEAARRLDSLLEATQKNKEQLRPTVSQLQTMMGILNSKLVLSDFAKSVAGWEIWLRNVLPQQEEARLEISVAEVPPKSPMVDLIQALSENCRIGEEETIDIKTRAQYVPWTIAFVKWCIGIPPLLRLANGKTLLGQEGTPIILTVLPHPESISGRKRRYSAEENEFQAVSIRHVKGIREVIFKEDPQDKTFAWRGMMDVETWMQYRIGLLHDRFPALRSNNELKTATGQALYFIIKHVPARLILYEDYKALEEPGKVKGPRANDYRPLGQNAFLTPELRLKIAQELLDDHLLLAHKDSDPNQTLRPDKLANLISGACAYCERNEAVPLALTGTPCKVNEFLKEIGSIGAALLIFTLFGTVLEVFPMIMGGPGSNPDNIHQRLYPIKSNYAIKTGNWLKLITTGWQALMHGECKMLACDAFTIFRHAAKLLGHENIAESTVISSKCGQVLYPTFFESTEFIRTGFLQLSAFPGYLSMDGMRFDCFVDAWINPISDRFSDMETEEIALVDDDSMETTSESVYHRGEQDEENLEGRREEQEAAIQARMGREQVGANGSEQIEAAEGGREEQRQTSEASNSDGRNHRDEGERVSPQPTLVPVDFTSPRFSSPHIQHMEWRVSVAENRLLGELKLPVVDRRVLAWSVISSLSSAIYTKHCGHKSNRGAGDLGRLFRLEEIKPRTIDLLEPRTLIYVGRSFGKQLYALQLQNDKVPSVVHVDGCLQCALQLCLSEGSNVVIS